jgi:hypothetical protein
MIYGSRISTWDRTLKSKNAYFLCYIRDDLCDENLRLALEGTVWDAPAPITSEIMALNEAKEKEILEYRQR